MTFRLRIFLLVTLVAVSAIGATAFLTLNLTSREVTRSRLAAEQHQEEIVATVQHFGLTQGRWNELVGVVVELSQRTKLHIRLDTVDGETLVDSDLERFGDGSGQMQPVPVSVDPRPGLAPAVVTAATIAAKMQAVPDKKTGPDPKEFVIPVALPTDLFGPEPTSGARSTPGALALRQLAQYRAALVTARCVAASEPGAVGAMPLAQAPYLTPELLRDQPECVRQGTRKVLTDDSWLGDYAQTFGRCALPSQNRSGSCLVSEFYDAVSSTSAVPLNLYLGAPGETDVGQLGRPAAFGAAGLLVVALAGTAWIARRVSDPVRRLTEASQRLAAGELDVRVPTGGRDEIARLSASFNTMAAAVQRSEEMQRQLVADVAHEMRTPLSNLRGYLEGLADGIVEPSRELFASLHEETLLQRRILDDLQVLALAENGDLRYTRSPADLADLVTSGALVHRATAVAAGIALTVDAPRPVWVEADPDRLRQVLGNLLTNAIRYTDAQGHVQVKVTAANGQAVLSVQDTGVGIDPGDLHRVFDRFWRADPARQRATGGTGLGLTIAQRIVTDHRGTIEVTSRPGTGTTFTVRLPATTPPPATP